MKATTMTTTHRRRDELLSQYARCRCRERLLVVIVGTKEDDFGDRDSNKDEDSNYEDAWRCGGNDSLGGIDNDKYVKVVAALSSRLDH